MKSPSIFMAQQYTDRDLIESVVASFYIIDYGFISKVNGDKTVNVTHAKRLKTLAGETLPQVTTKNVEVLTISTGGLSINLNYQEGDKVLLLGLKDFVEHVDEVQQATESTVFYHYSRSTMKALPLCIFNAEAKVQVEAEDGSLSINTEDKIKLNGDDKQLVTYEALNQALQQLWTTIQTHTHSVAVAGSSGAAAPSTELATASLDISGAKTTTVVTGG